MEEDGKEKVYIMEVLDNGRKS
ncbi:hypothetical protein HKBW3S03_00682, partial [Candidatus Hakubella thermalkaliphila]